MPVAILALSPASATDDPKATQAHLNGALATMTWLKSVGAQMFVGRVRTTIGIGARLGRA
jgi:hypothetical protein